MGSEARARLGLAGLLLMVLYSMSQLFEGGDYAGPAMLAAVIATLTAMLARRLGISVLATFVLSNAALGWYLILIFEGRETFFGLPTVGAARGLVTSVSRAYAHSQVDFAPVPIRPGYVILIVLAFWAMATIGEIATFRWRRPLAATVGPLGMFTLVQIVGTNTGSYVLVPAFMAAMLTYWGLEASHRLRSWGRWVATWRGRKAPEPQSLTGALARRMGAACVVVALAAPAFLPSLGDGLLSWRNPGGGGPFAGGVGGDGRVVDPLVSLIPQLITRTDLELFRVRAEDPLYWRLVTLSTFDGQIWTPEGQPTAPAPTGAIAVDIDPPQPGDVVEQSFEITGLEGHDLPAAYLPGTVEFAEESDDFREELEYDPDTADLELEEPLSKGLRYNVLSTIPDATFATMQDARPADAGSQYTALPDDIDPRIAGIVRRWTRRAESPFQQLLAIQNRLRGFNYTLGVDTSASSDYLYRFLTEIRAGYCQQFATAFTVMARMLGYSARVAVGFLPGSTSPEAPTEYVVRGTDAHAWPEVFFEGFGWVTFEPTPRGEAVPPEYTSPAAPEADLPIGVNLRGPENLFGNPQGGPGGAGPNSPQQFPQGRGQRFGPGRAAAPDRANARWERAFNDLTRLLLALVIAFLIAVPTYKLWRIARRYRAARDGGATATAAFLEFEEEAGELATPRARSESAVTYARRVASLRAIPRASALRLARIYEAAQFAPAPIPGEQGAEARRIARELRGSLWAESSWWNRAVRLFSPTGLTGRL